MQSTTKRYSIQEMILANLRFVGEAEMSHVKAGARNQGCTEEEAKKAIRDLIKQGQVCMIRVGVLGAKQNTTTRPGYTSRASPHATNAKHESAPGTIKKGEIT